MSAILDCLLFVNEAHFGFDESLYSWCVGVAVLRLVIMCLSPSTSSFVVVYTEE